MSIAWGSLVLLVVLLPGVLFFVGVYWPEQFTRESEPRSPLGQLAGALLVAFVVHGLAYTTLTSFCGSWLPCISLKGLLDAVNIDPGDAGATAGIDRMVRQFRWWIFLYVLATAAGGITLGALYGSLIVKRRIRHFSRHRWIYDLSIDGLTYAYILTNVTHEDRILMYKGFLRAFGLQQDGKFSYIVLSDVTRMYLHLAEDASYTSAADVRNMIGASTPGEVVLPTEPAAPKKRVKSLFVIEGEDISNAVFDILETEAKPLDTAALRQLLREESAKIGLELSEADLDDLAGRTSE